MLFNLRLILSLLSLIGGLSTALSMYFENHFASTFLPVVWLCNTFLGSICSHPTGEGVGQILGFNSEQLFIALFSFVLILFPYSSLFKKDKSFSLAYAIGTLVLTLFALSQLLLSEFLQKSFAGYSLLLGGFSLLTLASLLTKKTLELFKKSESLSSSWIHKNWLAFSLSCLALLTLQHVQLTQERKAQEFQTQLKEVSPEELYARYQETKIEPLLLGQLPPKTLDIGLLTQTPKENKPFIDVVLFADLECPPCLEELKYWRKLPQELAPFIRIRLIHFPFSSRCRDDVPDLHPHACDYAYQLLKLPPAEALALLDERKNYPLETYSRLYGKKILYEANSSNALLLKQHIEFGKKLNIHSTPTLYVEGKKVDLLKAQTLTALLRKILEAKSSLEKVSYLDTLEKDSGLNSIAMTSWSKNEAAVKVLEVSSFQCYHSKKMHQLLKTLQGKTAVSIYFKPVPFRDTDFTYEFEARTLFAYYRYIAESKNVFEAENRRTSLPKLLDLFFSLEEKSLSDLQQKTGNFFVKEKQDLVAIKRLFNSEQIKQDYEANLKDLIANQAHFTPRLYSKGKLYASGPDEAKLLTFFDD